MAIAVISDQGQALITLQMYTYASDEVKTTTCWMAIPDPRTKHKLLPGMLKQERSRRTMSRYKNLK